MDRKTLAEKYSYLFNRSLLFKGLGREEIEEALDIMDSCYAQYAKGDFLHMPYTEMKAFGMVLSGVAQACMDDVEGNRMIMAEVVPGATFGESLCFLEIKDSPVYVYASEQAEVLWLSAGSLFGEGADRFKVQLQKQFTAMLAARTLAMNNRIQVLSKLHLRDKLITYFSEMARASGSMTFQIPINRDDLATYMGTNRSALSRELAKMKQEGLIDYYKNTFRILTEQ